MAQYPLTRRVRRRTILNETVGGGRITLADPEYARLEWEIDYQGLTAEERDALHDLFDECEGGLGEFVFPDPVGNLLARSGEPHVAPWTRDPLLSWTTNITGPLAGTTAGRLVNSAPVAQTLSQSVGLPGDYAYSFSVYARSASPVTVTAGWSQGAASHEETFAVGPAWRRLETAGKLEATGTPVVFWLRLPGAASVELFGFQAEAQLANSAYRRTLAQSGVFTNARFAQDELTFIANGVDNYSVRVRVRARATN